MLNDIVNRFIFTQEDKKDDKWATDMVRFVQIDARQVITEKDYDKGQVILSGEFPDADLNKIFSGPAMQRAKAKIPGFLKRFKTH